MPERIRLSRQRGWRKPENAVVVARPGRFGNPFRIGDPSPHGDGPMTRTEAVAAFRDSLDEDARARIRRDLRGHDLACWCPLDGPCHADVLLEVANAD